MAHRDFCAQIIRSLAAPARVYWSTFSESPKPPCKISEYLKTAKHKSPAEILLDETPHGQKGQDALRHQMGA